jgi:hypothetical protein
MFDLLILVVPLNIVIPLIWGRAVKLLARLPVAMLGPGLNLGRKYSWLKIWLKCQTKFVSQFLFDINIS